MRAGICSIQQALTVEALSIVKQAVNLARRRGHAQVTPLHVASSMLASSTGLLRRACLQSHSHPLQCKALELCFNVALNRLPASTSSPLLGHTHSSHPSLSNALVAALKRAQAHQRRGSIENQQQPILALKIEIEQLVISILDDPSVSRVMREAGFSSTQVKSRVEQAVSLEASNPDSSQPLKEVTVTAAKPLSVHFAAHPSLEQASNEDVASVLDDFLGKRRNVVIVGEELSRPEAVVRGVVDKFERGLVPMELRSVQLISLPLFSLRNWSREEVEQRLTDIRSLVKSSVSIGRGIVFYLGDMQGVSDFWSNYLEHRNNHMYYYSSNLVYFVLELKKLVAGCGDSNTRICLMGIATFRTYMNCKVGHPSLEANWDLHSLTVPAGSLSLSLNLDSDLQVDCKSNVLTVVEKNRTCLKDHLAINWDKGVQAITGAEVKDPAAETSTKSSLPLWLQQCKNEKSRDSPHCKEEDCEGAINHCKKWSSFCDRAPQNSLHGKTLGFYSTPSSPTTSFSSPESHLSWPALIDFKQCPKEHQFWTSNDGEMADPPKPEILSNPNSSPNSASSSEVAEDMNACNPSFKEFSPENKRVLSDALAAKVPGQTEIISQIVDTVLKCRSGNGDKNGESWPGHKRMETSMLFLGLDSNAKESIARELAKVVFGSRGNFISIGLSRFSDSVQEHGKKRPRGTGFSYLQRFGEAVNENPHRVFFLEDADQFDYSSRFGMKRAMESGRISVSGGETVNLEDAIIIFSYESLNPMPRREKKIPDQQEQEKENEVKQGTNSEEEEKKPGSLSLDLNMAMDDEDDGIGMFMDCVDGRILFESSVQERASERSKVITY